VQPATAAAASWRSAPLWCALSNPLVRLGLVRAGRGVAKGQIGAGTKLRIVDAVLTGAHEPGTSHYALLGAFLDDTMLREVDAALAANHYRTHEFGDSIFIEHTFSRRLDHTTGLPLGYLVTSP
jgi:S-adenosylmethionine:tRNA ribosyltransferase-isomerase